MDGESWLVRVASQRAQASDSACHCFVSIARDATAADDREHQYKTYLMWGLADKPGAEGPFPLIRFSYLSLALFSISSMLGTAAYLYISSAFDLL